MRIEIYNKESGVLADPYCYFVMHSKVYRDNGDYYESHSSVVNFDDFIEEAPDVWAWRVIGD